MGKPLLTSAPHMGASLSPRCSISDPADAPGKADAGPSALAPAAPSGVPGFSGCERWERRGEILSHLLWRCSKPAGGTAGDVVPLVFSA